MPHLLRECGWVKLYRTEEAFAGAALEREILTQHGVPFEILDGAGVQALEPALIRPFARAMLLPETGAVGDPGGLVEAAERLFSGLGGRAIRTTVSRLEPGPEGWRVVHPGGAIRARQVVLATGAAANELSRPLGYRFAFAAERGYHRHYALHPGSPPLTRPIYDTGAASILSPMGEGRVRVLSGVEVADRHAEPDYSQIEAAARGGRRYGAASASRSTTGPGSARAPRPRTACR